MSKENKTSDKQQNGNDFIADVRLSFDELSDAIIKYNAKSEYKQASIVILRKIFESHKA